MANQAVTARLGVPAHLIASVALGTLLNPLNSSMIAVALVDLQRHFGVGVGTSTWLISGFYLASATGQPLMGRLVDLLGTRRLFVSGLLIVLAFSVLAPLAPGFWWLVALRAGQALGTSTAYPSALAAFRATAPGPAPPAGALGALGIIASSSAALGPVLGGVLVVIAGWQAIFLVNVPLAVAGIVLALAVLPRAETRSRRPARDLLRDIDLPGLVLFSGSVTTLLILLLSLARQPLWWLGPIAAAEIFLLVWRERRAPAPFIDVRNLIVNRPLTSVLVQQGGVNLIFYSLFFALPIWLEAVRGFTSERAGVLMLPFTIMGVLVIPIAAQAIGRRGSRPVLITGSAFMLIGTTMVQFLGDATPVLLLLVIAIVLGIPNGLNNIGLQTGLYEAIPPERTGSSGGLFQTFRYLGAILAGSLLGVILDRDLSTRGLHHVGLVLTASAAILLLLAFLLPRNLSQGRRT